MVARRNALSGSHDKLPKLIEEAGMRHYIAVSTHYVILFVDDLNSSQNPKFIEYLPVHTSNIKIDFPLFKLPQIPHKLPSEVITLKIPALLPSPQHRVSVEGVITPKASTSQLPPSPRLDAPPKKKLRVRFEWWTCMYCSCVFGCMYVYLIAYFDRVSCKLRIFLV